MSFEYDRYLIEHRGGVRKSYDWLRENLPDIFEDDFDYESVINAHDASKDNPDEYEAYDAYFYGGNRSYSVVQSFNKAFLLHLHRNPHHWQYWVLIQDDPSHEEIVFNMDHPYIIEMICDWWSFSWKSGNLNEIFDWYDSHKEHIKLGKKTRKTVEHILKSMKEKMEAKNVESE